jgi:hypothetical protein
MLRTKGIEIDMIILPNRSRRFGIGKEIGGAVYLHRDYECLLGEPLAGAKTRLPDGFDYTIVKYNLRTSHVTFVASPDFDSSPEPIVCDHWIVPVGETARFRPALPDPYIYHHKWLMVPDDYGRFEVEQSKERSRLWLALPDVDKARIGRRSYWEQVVVPRFSIEPTTQQAW